MKTIYWLLVWLVLWLSPLAYSQTYSQQFDFTDSSGTRFPVFSMVEDSAGNFYGVSQETGSNGSVFELSLVAGVWTESTIWEFYSGAPTGPLVIDSAGNLYDVAGYQVFELSLIGGVWTETILPTSFNVSSFGVILFPS
jgi:hypothetical protein